MLQNDYDDLENDTILTLKQISKQLIQHGMNYEWFDGYIKCDGEILKEMSIKELKEWLGY